MIITSPRYFVTVLAYSQYSSPSGIWNLQQSHSDILKWCWALVISPSHMRTWDQNRTWPDDKIRRRIRKATSLTRLLVSSEESLILSCSLPSVSMKSTCVAQMSITAKHLCGKAIIIYSHLLTACFVHCDIFLQNFLTPGGDLQLRVISIPLSPYVWQVQRHQLLHEGWQHLKERLLESSQAFLKVFK